MPKKILEARFHLFEMGHWQELLDASIRNAKIHQRSVRRRRQELSRWFKCQALDGAPVARGTLATLRALTDPGKRPPTADKS